MGRIFMIDLPEGFPYIPMVEKLHLLNILGGKDVSINQAG
jgi:hypothetical protein